VYSRCYATTARWEDIPGLLLRNRLGKQVPAATDTNAMKVELCFLCGPYRDVINKGQGPLIISSVRESVKRENEPEPEE
jgi:hypothetical protein